tara:strand:- start:42 stop:260 length:219 start_codon:yes stop_codon:yes gene_type:complete
MTDEEVISIRDKMMNPKFISKYFTLTALLQQGTHSFQLKIENEGLVLDIFQHIFEDEYEHIDTMFIMYENIV